MKIYEKLLAIQSELKAPKNQFNKFGGYNYRNCEDILEALKPLLVKHKATIIIYDTIENLGDRFYVKATVEFINVEDNAKITATSSAREELSKKGMDSSQLTGATSSYARKYALNGLFGIDDTKDSDFTNTHGKEPQTPKKEQEFKCENCETVFPPFEFQGKKFTSAQAHELSKKKNNGVALCKTCSDKRTSEAVD